MFIGILILASLPRFLGLLSGLPEHPEFRERYIVETALNLEHRTGFPEEYFWPGTFWYLVLALWFRLGEAVHGGALAVGDATTWARFLSVILSLATVWLTFHLGRRAYGVEVGLLGALFLAGMMLHATQESRFALVDTPLTLLAVWVLMRCFPERTEWNWRYTAGLGALLGLAIATKFVAVVLILPVLCALSMAVAKQRARERKGKKPPSEGEFAHPPLVKPLLQQGGVGLLFAVLAFTVACPFWIYPAGDKFVSGVQYALTHYQKGHYGLFASDVFTPLRRVTYLWPLLAWGMGWPLALLSIVWLGWALWRRERGDVLLLWGVIPLLALLAGYKAKFPHHLLMLYPVLAVGAARVLLAVRAWARPRGAKWIWRVAVAGVFAYSFAYTLAFANVYRASPTIVQAQRWISVSVPIGKTVSVGPELPLRWLIPEVPGTVVEADFEADSEFILVPAPAARLYRAYTSKPQAYRLEDWHPLEAYDPKPQATFYQRLFAADSGYEVVQKFSNPPRLWRWTIDLSEAPPPFGMLTNPEITVYRRAKVE